MARIAYVNGAYAPLCEAGVSVEDRGFQFADGVYEVIYFHNGSLLDADMHYARLERSLEELCIAAPMSRKALSHVVKETMRRNRLPRGLVYIQITRGQAPRIHQFPPDAVPSLIVTVRPITLPGRSAIESGVSVISLPDIRWKRCDIKTVSLLPNILCKQKAVESDAYEAWLLDQDGMVTEGTTSNAWIVKGKTIATRNPGRAILNGVVRQHLLELCGEKGYAFEERAFSLEEAKNADEAFLTSSGAMVMPVVSIDGTKVGNGIPGPATLALCEIFYRDALKEPWS